MDFPTNKVQGKLDQAAIKAEESLKGPLGKQGTIQRISKRSEQVNIQKTSWS